VRVDAFDHSAWRRRRVDAAATQWMIGASRPCVKGRPMSNSIENIGHFVQHGGTVMKSASPLNTARVHRDQV
jgi:hypothetical protein